MGYRESVNLAQINTFIQMDSHEEKVAIALIEVSVALEITYYDNISMSRYQHLVHPRSSKGWNSLVHLIVFHCFSSRLYGLFSIFYYNYMTNLLTDTRKRS